MVPSGRGSISHPLGDGVLNLNKPAGWTSHDVVARLRKSVPGIKVGHAGTLDPAATGVLPILIGRGTRIAEYLVEWDKEYRAVLRLGETTDTLDATGIVQERSSLAGVTESNIRKVIGAFIGKIRQMPPMYSAVKVNGVPLYKTAREGRTIDRALREVVIHTLDIERLDGRDIFLRISCSKGTYIRSLCADIGAALGVGGHLRALERTKVGPLTVEQAISVEEFEAGHGSGLAALSWLSLDDALGALPACRVSPESARKVLHGMALPYGSIVEWEVMPQPEPDDAKPLRIKDLQGRLLAVGLLRHVGGEGGARWHPSRQLAIKKVFISEDVATCVS